MVVFKIRQVRPAMCNASGVKAEILVNGPVSPFGDATNEVHVLHVFVTGRLCAEAGWIFELAILGGPIVTCRHP